MTKRETLRKMAEIGDLNGLFAINVGNLGLSDDELDNFMEE